MNEKLLIVEDEETLCESLKRVLSREGYSVDTVSSAEAAFESLGTGIYDLIITDIILPGITGIEFLKKVKDRTPEQMVIVMTAYASLETAVEALRTGAYDYVVKPVMHEEIKQIVKNAVSHSALRKENIFLKSQVEKRYDLSCIIGESPEMQAVKDEIKKISDSADNVLLRGEVGTGKALVAKAIHFNSGRSRSPFISVNCAAVSGDRLESRLFGDSTGPMNAEKSGSAFEEADGGTVLLKRIHFLNNGLQSKLLGYLTENEKKRKSPVSRGVNMDARLISATEGDIESAVRGGGFIRDLFDRINTVSIILPPLRERRQDIGPLADHFVRKYSGELGKTVKGIEDEALVFLASYLWPGNVRELRNVIERAILVCEGDLLRLENLPQLFPAK